MHSRHSIASVHPKGGTQSASFHAAHAPRISPSLVSQLEAVKRTSEAHDGDFTSTLEMWAHCLDPLCPPRHGDALEIWASFTSLSLLLSLSTSDSWSGRCDFMPIRVIHPLVPPDDCLTPTFPHDADPLQRERPQGRLLTRRRWGLLRRTRRSHSCRTSLCSLRACGTPTISQMLSTATPSGTKACLSSSQQPQRVEVRFARPPLVLPLLPLSHALLRVRDASPDYAGAFFITHDKRFILKTLAKSEASFLLDMLYIYYEHVLRSASKPLPPPPNLGPLLLRDDSSND